MYYFTKFLAFCCVFTACSPVNTPENIAPSTATTEKVEEKTDSLPFPESWFGNWVGELNIYRENKIVQTIPMELEMAAIDSSENFIWAIIYGEDKEAGRRAYELEVIDAEKGHYRVDENNSIKLETYLFENRLYSWYQVAGNMILSIYEKREEEMVFEIVFGSGTPVSITGGTVVEGEDIPTVETYPVNGIQRGLLHRK